MKKYILNVWTFVVCVVMMLSCTQEDIVPVLPGGAPEGYVKVSFGVDVPEMTKVAVRAVDPDGEDIHNMTLFCFNPYGLFIAAVDATLSPVTGVSGRFDAIIPEETKIIHFIANQNPGLYSDEDFVNKTEASVIADMEGASGMLIYWARFEASDNGETLKAELAAGGDVQMIRNQAKVSIANWNTAYLKVTGFVTAGIHAFGTVAPHSNNEGFNWPGTEEYVTLPRNRAFMSDIEDVNTKNEDYIFEHENSSDNPVSVIIKGIPQGGDRELYYRVALVGPNGEQLLIKRNYSYVLNISGNLTHGSETFQEALEAPFTNNVWISIDSWVKQVEDGTFKLSVDETGIVLNADQAGGEYTINYTIQRKNGTLTDADIADVSWVGSNDVAEHDFVSHTFDTATGRGTIVVKLNPVSKHMHKGVLMVKKGLLQRTVELIVIETQHFTPSWVGTQVFGGTTGQYVTLKFTIPESCPEILYPFPVLITVNSLDVRAASGMQLPVLRKGDDEWFGADYEGHEYKYEYIVDGPGVHRVYFENILEHEDGDREMLWVEANYFETLAKEVVFSGRNYSITVSGLNEFTPDNYDGSWAADEKVYYKLVPKKRGAHVDFNMVMMDNSRNPALAFNVGEDDEFLLYSKTLDHYGDDESIPGGHQKECNYYEVPFDIWDASTSGRVVMFMPKNVNAPNVGHYALHLKTNRAVSDDVVRISSNQAGDPSILPANGGADYLGNSYRSMIFELATYRPFRFAARVNGLGENAAGQDEEEVSDISLSYAPNQNVDISFDITSFMGSDGASVDPFGEEFEIYIDAPMLRIDEARLAEFKLNGAKLFEHPTIPGRFVYLVSATRDEERQYGYGEVILEDGTGADQTGERKTLPFKTKKITSAGNITLSSNVEKVVYYEKTFRITNETIDGTIQYNDGGVLTNVPRDAFVAFARTKDGVRIGSIKVSSDGRYSLNLRSEYEFSWSTEEIEFSFEDTNGVVYDLQLSSLGALFANPDVVLQPAV